MKLGAGRRKSLNEISLERWDTVVKRKKRWRLRKKAVGVTLKTMIAACFAVLFLMPILLTITNSFMSASEISSNYGQVFATNDSGGKVYISETVNLKFIPDMVSFSQYITVLLKSPEYLFKFWNSVILVVPIVVFQLLVAAGASFGFTRYRGRVKEMIFFIYIILMLMPYQVTLVPNYLVSDWLHILDTNWAIWLPGIFPDALCALLNLAPRKHHLMPAACTFQPEIRPHAQNLPLRAAAGVRLFQFDDIAHFIFISHNTSHFSYTL